MIGAGVALLGEWLFFSGLFRCKFGRLLKTIRCKKPSIIFSRGGTIPKMPPKF